MFTVSVHKTTKRFFFQACDDARSVRQLVAQVRHAYPHARIKVWRGLQLINSF